MGIDDFVSYEKPLTTEPRAKSSFYPTHVGDFNSLNRNSTIPGPCTDAVLPHRLHSSVSSSPAQRDSTAFTFPVLPPPPPIAIPVTSPLPASSFSFGSPALGHFFSYSAGSASGDSGSDSSAPLPCGNTRDWRLSSLLIPSDTAADELAADTLPTQVSRAKTGPPASLVLGLTPLGLIPDTPAFSYNELRLTELRQNDRKIARRPVECTLDTHVLSFRLPGIGSDSSGQTPPTVPETSAARSDRHPQQLPSLADLALLPRAGELQFAIGADPRMDLGLGVTKSPEGLPSAPALWDGVPTQPTFWSTPALRQFASNTHLTNQFNPTNSRGGRFSPIEIDGGSHWESTVGPVLTEREREREKLMVGAPKRRWEMEHEMNARGNGDTPKRGKTFDHDYKHPLPNYIGSTLRAGPSADDTVPGAGEDDFANNVQPTVKIQSEQISCEEMFRHLVDHGCVDLSSHMDPRYYSSGLVIGGAFGDIWKGKLRDGTEVAIKVWRFSSLLHNGWKSMKRAMREIYYWSKVKHEYVQELVGVILFQGRLGMVSRWMEHGNLREYICKNPSADRYLLCIQVATGIAYLHSREMVHGDLKGINVLVSRDGVAKLSDFDHSIMSECSLAFSETSKLGGGTTRWMAPELILEDDCSRSAYTDVYALGMTMLEIMTGTSPYYPQCKDDVNVIKAVMKKILPIRPAEHLGNNMRDNRMWELLLRCWNYDPLARPKAVEVVESLQMITNLPTTGGLV